MLFSYICYAIAFLGCAKVEAQYNPYFMPNRTGIVQLFEWKFGDIAMECEEFLGPNGYAGVQISPITENIVSERRSWLERYQPISYLIESRSGNENEFSDMVKRCYNAGIRIYPDVVINHMAARLDKMIGTAGSTASELDYPGVPYTRDEFNLECEVKNYFNAYEVRNCWVHNCPDLNQHLESVRLKIVEFLNRAIDSGVAGFRVGAAKHMWPNNLKAIFEKTNNLNTEFDFEPESRPFSFLEVIDYGDEHISKSEYTHLGSIAETLFSEKLGQIFRGQHPLHELINWGPSMGFLPSSDAVVYVDNYDVQRGYGGASSNILTFKTPRQYKMANAFMLSHPYGTPIISSSYRFEDPIGGPPADENNNILSPEIESGYCKEPWICEHRWREINNMIKFRNIVDGTSISHWQEGGPNQIAFCRGDKGFIAFNNDPENNLERKFFVCLPPGKYCDVIADSIVGNECKNIIDVDENNQAMIHVPFDAENGVVAYHLGSKIPEV